MVDKEKVLVGLKSCADSTGALCRTCPYDFVHNENCMGDMARDALELLKENDIELERICQNICTYINGGCSTDTEADKQHVCKMIGRIFCAGGRVVLTSGE